MGSNNWTVGTTTKKFGRLIEEKLKQIKQQVCYPPAPWKHKTTLLTIPESMTFFQTPEL